MCGSSLSLLREKLSVGDSLPITWHCVRGGIYDENVSQPFLPVFIRVCSQLSDVSLVSGYLSKGITPRVAVYLVHPWEEGNSGASCVTILIWSRECFLYLSVCFCLHCNCSDFTCWGSGLHSLCLTPVFFFS